MSTITATNLHGDTIRKTGGSLGVDIRVKNTSVYESDGGTSVTQNTVQSLTKVWCHFTMQTTTAFRDSFNCSGITDLGTGQATVAYSNSFSNDDYSAVQYNNASNVITSYNNHFAGGLDNRTSSQTRLACNNGSAAVDAHLCDIQISGDLA